MGESRVGSEELATVRLPEAPPEAPPETPPAPAVAQAWAGRYTLVRKLAEGGMGAVYIAYDDQLGRRVAVKLLRQSVRSATFQQRMHREAQALARLSHPNVVQVYDVGHHDDQLFVTMELVVGSDLRKWWKAAPRTWRAVLDVILQAGEGLAAAHRAGLVHRDIKPDNILVGDDGRVRVADFGLARTETSDAADPAPAPDSEPQTPGSLLDTPITELGHILGTPAYMAPEQLVRLPSGARSDLFALCVVLYEGIYGERPFRGKTWQELAISTNAGLFTPPVRDPPIPAWLARAIARGLSVDPEDRHPSIDALLVDLRRPQQLVRRRWQWGLALGGLGLGLGLGFAALRGEPPCVGVDAAAAALWTADRQASVHAALIAVSPIAGAEISERLAARIGQRVHDLGDMSRETCLAYRRGELSDSLYDRARACLDRRHGEVAALLAVLTAPDAETVAKSLTAVDALRDLAACSDRAALIAQVAPPDPASAGPAAALEHRLDQARALRLAGRYTEVDGQLAPLVADAETLAYPPLIAEARIERALVSLELARIPAAADDLSAAAALAESIGADELRLAALTAWLRAAGLSADPSPALLAALEPQALALVERRGDTGRKAHARVLLAAGEANLDRDPAHASERLTAATAVFEALGDAAKPELAETLNDLAMIRSGQRRYSEAHALYQRARELLESTFGPHHPNLGFIANNEARAYDKQGDRAAARTWFSAAVALWEPVYGPDHPNTLVAVLHLARMAHELGDDAAAANHAGRVLAARARTKGEDHLSLAPPLQLLARIDLARGDRTSARARSERALAIRERADGPASPKLSEELELLTQIALADDRPADALALAERRLALARSDTARAAANLDLAQVHWTRGDHLTAHTTAALASAHSPDKAAAWLAAHPRP